MTMLGSVQERLQQHRDRTLLKAAMAASALAAYADGTVSLSERYSIDGLLANLERLKLHDPEKAVQILDEYIHALESNPSPGRGFLMTRGMGLECLGGGARAESSLSDRLSVGGRPMYPTLAMGNCTILCTGYSYGSTKTSGDDTKSPRMS